MTDITALHWQYPIPPEAVEAAAAEIFKIRLAERPYPHSPHLIEWLIDVARKDATTALRAEVEQWKQGHAAACDLAERHMEEKHRLRADNERLRAALQDVYMTTRCDKTAAKARAALAAQPAPGKVEPRTDSRYNNAERIFGDD